MFDRESRRPVVVVEIGNDWLKIAESRFSAKGRCITKAKFIRLVDIKGPLKDAVAKLFKSLKLGAHAIVTYLPRHLVNVRIMELPSIDPREIDDMVNLQVGKQTPYAKEEIVSAHKVIDTSREGYIKMMLVIAKRNVVTERMDTLEASGVGVEKVALSSEGVYSWFKAAYMPGLAQYFEQSMVLVDIDSNYSDFIVIRRGKPVFTRNIFIGVENMVKNRAEWQEKFIEELNRSIERYRNEDKAAKVAKIFLSGAARSIQDLDKLLSSRLDIPTETTSPTRNLCIKKSVGILPDEDFRMVSPSALFGMAMNYRDLELDLTPEEARIHKSMEEKRKSLTVMGVLILTIALLFSSLLLGGIYTRTVYLKELQSKISKIEKTADEARRMRLRIDLVEKRLDAKGSTINILHEIHRLTPSEIHFSNINIEEKKQAILKGRAQAMSDVFRFVTTIENSPYFQNAKTTYTTTKKEKNVEYADFEIISTYEKR
ncbi:MAG: pilus assembly protein PilM [Omnitrophica bacterium]|nr:pilus assembly protein PilM [Candidatus Omnitrophota bacterium]